MTGTTINTLAPTPRLRAFRSTEELNHEAAATGGRSYRLPQGLPAKTVQLPTRLVQQGGGRGGFRIPMVTR